jgi:hypothetical protein
MNLSPLSATSNVAVQVPPPPRFRPLQGIPTGVTLAKLGDFPDGGTTAQRAGMRYERKVHEYLGRVLDNYRPSQAFRFFDAGRGVRFCVPDGVVLNPSRTFIFEFKFQHMPEAWWQLRQLYEPVLRSFNRDAETYVVEVCRSFDPAVPFPEPVRLVDDLMEYINRPFKEFAVLRWK